MMRHNNLLWKWAICRLLFPLLIFAVGMTKMNAQTLNKVSRDALMQSVQQEIPDRNSSTNTMQIVNSLPRTSRTNGQLDYTAYDWQSNAGAITRTIVWPDGKVNFGFTHASNASYSDRGTAIGTYDAVSDQWISSGGRVESEKTGFGSIARYGENGIVIAAHNSTTVGIFIIGNKDDVTSLQGSVSAVSHLNDSKEPTWANVMTSGPNRDIIHVVATGWSDNKIYYFRSQDGGQTWDKQNVVLPFMGSDYGPYWGSNCCYWMETTEDNCLSLVVNNPWSDGMVIYSYDNGETWQRKVFYQHPNPFGTFNEMFLYPRWTSCQWDSQHHLHVLYEFTGCSGSPNSSNSYPSVGGVAYWNETMPYNPNGITQSAIPGNLTPGQPFVMDKDYLYNDIYSSWWNYPNATHVMWPEYIGYLPALDDNGNWEDPYQATQFNITDWALHGFYHSSVCGFPVLCKVPGTDGMVAVWCAMDENHTDINGNFYFKIFASYSGDGGVNWTNMVHLTNTPAYHDKELVYLQATIVGNKLIIAAQCDGETGTYVQNNDSDPNDTYYQGFTFDLNELFDISGDLVSISATPNPSAGGHIFGTGSYNLGSECTLTATAFEGYTFVNWTENGEVVSTANPYTFTVTGNRSLVANFTISGGDEHEYVDLGLPSGLLWATCNVGASNPEEYGDCFAWGETQPKDTYNWNNYQYCNGSNNTLTKYCNDANYGYNGFTDTLTILQPSDDAATANWGAYWHTPTKEEWQELYQNTTHVWTTQNGVNGQLFTASNGNSLFLPATAGRYGYYWLSSVNTDSPSNAWELYFSSGNYCGTDYYDRYYGQSVRAVRSPMFIIDVTANPTEGGEITGGGDYQGGANCTLTATANEGYTFVNWTENGEVVSTEASYTFIVTGNRNLIANFAVSGGDGHQYVDLGLPSGTLWATCNVGADTPEGYGDYFAWGETQPKNTYDWSTYQYCNGSYKTLTKYCNNTSYGYNGFTDTLTILLPEDDAATTNWGASWRVPTKEEWEELYGNTTYIWTIYNGVNGYLFTAPNGNSLFLPAAGYRWHDELKYPGEHGVYLSSSLYTSNPLCSWVFYLRSSFPYMYDLGYRYDGHSVRAVRSSQDLIIVSASANPLEGGTVTGGGNYTQGETCTLTATPNEGYQFLYWTEDEDVVSMEATYSFTVTDNRTLVANFVAYNPSSDLQVFAEYYPDSSNVFSPYVKVYWTGITASRYNIYRAFCYSDDYELIAENVTDTLYIDYAWFNLPLGNYKYGVSVEDGRGGTGQIHWNDAPVPTNEILIDASTFGNPTANDGSLGMPLRVNYDNGWLHYDNGNYIKSIGSGLGMLHWGVKFPSETLASYAGNQLKKVAVYMRSGNNEILNISVHVGGTTAPGMSVCSMDFDVSGYNNGFVEFALPEPIFITGTENIWITLSQAGNYPAQASPDSGEPNGRWISLNGQTWMDMANYGLDGSWMIRGYVGDDPAIYWSNCIDKTHYSITATANPTEGGTVTGGGAYSQGTTCTLTAMANSGYHFANWTENGVVVSTNANYSFTVTRSRNLVAHFTTNSQVCAINVSTNPSYGGSANGGGYYYYGTICTVNALANSGYIFTNWTENGTVVSIDASYTFTVTGSRNLVANFTAIPQFCTINVYANPSYGGSVTGTGTFAYGINCTLTATATTGYIFLNWTENGTVVSTSSNYTFTVTRNRNLVANFTADLPYYGINAVPNPNGGGTITGTGIYMEGQNCTLKAFANSGYTFINWTKDGVVVSTNATYRFVVTEAANYVANFELRSYAITVTASPTEGGTVAGAGTYYYGATCTVTATANSGYFFANWTLNGRVVSYSAEYIFTVTGNRNLVANFVTNPQVCTISTFTNPSYGGTAVGAGYYYTGASCTLTATANSGYAFTNWTENNVVVSTEAEYTFTVTGDRNLAANFTPVGTISAIANPNYGGSITGGGTYQYGTRCTLRATANSGYLFVNWTENGVTVSTNAKYSFTVMGNRNLVANFTVNNNPQVYMISVFANPSYGGSITGSNTYAYGTSCTVTATANSGYTFLNWTENGTVVSTNADYTFTVTGNRTLLANFMADTQLYTINTFANPSYGGTVSGDGGFYYGSSCTVTATANNGYTFVNWTENGTVVSFNANYTFTVKRNRNLVANFSANMEYFGINATPNPIEGGTITGAGIYIEGQTCTLTASPSFGYVFVNWTENGTVVSFDASYTFTVTGSRSLVANFADDMSFVGINANPNPIEGGAIMGAGLYLPGQTCILMAVANSGYIFVNWTENGTLVSDNAECTFIVTGSRNLVANFDIQPSVTQTIQLSQGWNWCSFNVEITLDDLKAALVAALPGTAINIKSQTQNVMYQNGRWTGSLTALNLTRMYMISVGNNCEISLEGQPINPSTLTVTINSGVNWIAFPYSESMTVTDFFGSFPANNDQVKSQSQNARYQGNRWAGQLSTLVPGKGYMYISNTQGTRTFTFPANAK